ncbi:PLP-dependent aminotransferase family protein [Amycolatopsis sp. cmx-4-61]|uniref:aminotransferase-like domain-containing protein n=1 Tax=Amycolatopsis sp. cmx-4-61 TaxID=2790937 RepID=UPI00397C5607
MAGSGDRAGPLSHARRWQAGVVQAVSPPGVVDLATGYLDPALFPVDLVRDAYTRALAEFGSAALSYGDDRGVLALRAALAARAGPPCGPGHVLLTAGTSAALYLLATRLAQPGAVVFAEQRSYDLGCRLLADCGLRTWPVAMDSAGMDPQALHDALGEVRALGLPPAFAYLIPTFHNPTGLVVPARRRRELLAVAARHGLLVVEDDAYAELPLTGAAEPSMGELAGYHGVIRLGTFSKTLAPGLRLGWLLTDPAVVSRLGGHGVFRSGGSPNHLASLAVTTLVESGAYDRHLNWLRNRLRTRRNALAAALEARLAGVADFTLPAGGYFLWLCSRGEVGEAELTAAAARAGLVVAAGSRYGSGPPSLRLSYSFNAPDRLAAAVDRLAGALTMERT